MHLINVPSSEFNEIIQPQPIVDWENYGNQQPEEEYMIRQGYNTMDVGTDSNER